MEAVVSDNGPILPSKGKKRKWIYAKKPKGKLYNYRQWFGYSLLLFLFIAPFIKINGNPLVMFNIIERKFSIFGNMFFPQDFHIFLFGTLIILVSIVLFTAIFGRVWCGWACPQTIFLELIFRRIEYLIEGDANQQRKLNEGPNTDLRAWKKLLKHSIFIAISFFISNIFLAYIIGVDALWKIASDPIDQHLGGFIAIVIFTSIFYAVFAHVREIVCTTICPYGRFQGVLLDDQSLTVAYNAERGEPRGKQTKLSSNTKGDCVDCGLCVQVCPTGIDIRKGIQLECVNCTACIDACDAVMEKIDKPKRLIGFYSLGEIQYGKKEFKKNRVRHIIYGIVLVALISGFGYMLFNRSVLDGSLLRATGSTYQLSDDGKVTNLYTLELINKSGRKIGFELASADPKIQIQLVNKIDSLDKDGSAKIGLFLIGNTANVSKYKSDVKIQVLSEGKVVEHLKTTFIAPPGKKSNL